MATIVVTGATGFIGTSLVKKLKTLNHTVVEYARIFSPVQRVDLIYHLACPSTTEHVSSDPTGVMDTIFDVTRNALSIHPTATFVNASSIGASDTDNTFLPQLSYNIAKRAMEVYLANITNRRIVNYRIPSVYGQGMHSDNFIMRCVTGNAYPPHEPDQKYYISHIDDVVDGLITMSDINIIDTTVGQVYEHFVHSRSLTKVVELNTRV